MAAWLVCGLLALLGRAAASPAYLARADLVRSACAVALLPAAIELYARTPLLSTPAPLPRLSFPAGVQRVCIVLPGLGGPDATSQEIVRALSDRDTAVLQIDWRNGADQLRAPFVAQRVGESLGADLAAQLRGEGGSSVLSLHVIGISAGGFVADALLSTVARSLRGVQSNASPQVDPSAQQPQLPSLRAGPHSQRSASPHLRLTLCDAFTARGLLGFARPQTAYGVSRFGASADFCEAFLNTDDPVPSTALPLKSAVNYDVTEAEARKTFTPQPGDSLHAWPAAWYGSNVRGILRREGGLRPYHGVDGTPLRGSVCKVP
ncbi:MAG: hypothetical protein SGPRY_012413 [Prymnesium sp.]